MKIFNFAFLFFLLLLSLTHNYKVYGVYERSAHQTTAQRFFSRDPLSSRGQRFSCPSLEHACKLRSASFGSKHGSQTLSYTPFCAYLTRTNRKLKVMYSGLELYARYDRRVVDPNTHRNLSRIRHFGRTYAHISKTTGRTWTFYM